MTNSFHHDPAQQRKLDQQIDDAVAGDQRSLDQKVAGERPVNKLISALATPERDRVLDAQFEAEPLPARSVSRRKMESDEG